jgi:DNA-directed RNA polymerase beta' subunit
LPLLTALPAAAGRPEDLLLGVIPVPPVAIRPSVEMDGASNEDDITMKLMVRNQAVDSWFSYASRGRSWCT